MMTDTKRELHKGDTIMVFLDPMKGEQKEGYAELIERIPENHNWSEEDLQDMGLELWWVKFIRSGRVLEKLVNPQHKTDLIG